MRTLVPQHHRQPLIVVLDALGGRVERGLVPVFGAVGVAPVCAGDLAGVVRRDDGFEAGGVQPREGCVEGGEDGGVVDADGGGLEVGDCGCVGAAFDAAAGEAGDCGGCGERVVSGLSGGGAVVGSRQAEGGVGRIPSGVRGVEGTRARAGWLQELIHLPQRRTTLTPQLASVLM